MAVAASAALFLFFGGRPPKRIKEDYQQNYRQEDKATYAAPSCAGAIKAGRSSPGAVAAPGESQSSWSASAAAVRGASGW